jgi:hypothetical protein
MARASAGRVGSGEWGSASRANRAIRIAHGVVAFVGAGQGDQEVSSSLMRRVSRKLTQDRSILQSRGSVTLPEHAWFGRAITGERMPTVGSDEQTLMHFGCPRTSVIDLGGRRAVPGRTDTHTYLTPFALARVGPTTPTRARRLYDASVDPTEARKATVRRFGRSSRSMQRMYPISKQVREAAAELG